MSKPNEVSTLGEEVLQNGSHDVILGEKAGTSADVEDMKRMGKEQLFKVGVVVKSKLSRPRAMLTTASHSVTLVSYPFLALP